MKKNTPITKIVDHDLFDALVEENQRLREELRRVCSVSISSMFHTHRREGERFSESVLKGVTEIMQHMKYQDLHQIYEEGFSLANSSSVIDKYKNPRTRELK